MSTELQRQATSIRKQHLAVVPLHQGRPSLFLTAAEAAAVDVSTVHDAAYNGLVTLQQYDGRFEIYLNSLLHPSSISLQREMKTAEENRSLDVEITNLFNLLALYALEPAAHLVVEYLIRRYRVHEMNSHVLLQSMLVAHDTKVCWCDLYFFLTGYTPLIFYVLLLTSSVWCLIADLCEDRAALQIRRFSLGFLAGSENIRSAATSSSACAESTKRCHVIGDTNSVCADSFR